MGDALVPVEEVHLQYQLGPQERIVTGLLFGRRFRVLGPVGAVLCVMSLVPSLSDWNWALVPGGVTLLLSFIWGPFAVALHQPAVGLTATNEGLEIEAGTMRTYLPWRGVRRARLLAGYFALDVANWTVPVPCRALQREQLSLLQSFFGASRTTTPAAETMEPQIAVDGAILSLNHSPRLFDILLAFAWRPMNLAFVVLGLGIVLVSVRDATMAPGPGYDPQSYWSSVPFGMIVMFLPVWMPLLRFFVGGGTHGATERVAIDIYSDGYRARTDRVNSWVAWGSLKSARRVRRLIVFRMKGSSAEVYLSTSGLTPEQVAAFRSVLSKHGLDPG